jgi:hypothetical protein
VNIEETLQLFNETVGEFVLTMDEVIRCTLESIEYTKNDKLVIYGFADLIFNDLFVLNKRRLNTHLKNIRKARILSYTSLKSMDLVALEGFERYQLSELNYTFEYIDFLDSEPEIFESNKISFADFIHEQAGQNKKIYISLNTALSVVLEIEDLLKEREVNVSRKENTDVVLNIPKTIERSFLKNKYDIYIFITKPGYPLDIFNYLKEINESPEVYIDSTMINSFSLSQFDQSSNKIVVKDSKEFASYAELTKELQTESVVVSDYTRFDFPDNKMDFSNLSKSDYEAIRSFVKVKLVMDLDVKTCQLASPCSPKDRSKKLNSLSNKISSFDYRCDVTCELFKDRTIGVVIWNEMFANRKKISVQSGQTFIYQTTSGTWKFTSVN